MRLELGARLRVGLRHVDRHEPAHLLGRSGVSLLLTGLPEVVEVLLEDPLVEVRDTHVGPPPPGDEVHRLVAPSARDPDRRMRLLHRSRPRVHVAELVVLPHVDEGPRLGPAAQDQVERLAEALAGLGRVEAVRVVLGSAPDHHAGDQSTPRDAIDHRILLRDADGRVVEGQRVADDRDPHAHRLAREDRRDQVRRRHVSVGIGVVLVDADAVEAERLGADELVEVAVVQAVAPAAVVEAVGAPHPGGTHVRLRQVGPGHQVEHEELHGARTTGCRSALSRRAVGASDTSGLRCRPTHVGGPPERRRGAIRVGTAHATHTDV